MMKGNSNFLVYAQCKCTPRIWGRASQPAATVSYPAPGGPSDGVHVAADSSCAEAASEAEPPASWPCVHLLSISSEAAGWSIGTMWPASCTCETHGRLSRVPHRARNRRVDGGRRRRERRPPSRNWGARGSSASPLPRRPLRRARKKTRQSLPYRTTPWSGPTSSSLLKRRTQLELSGK